MAVRKLMNDDRPSEGYSTKVIEQQTGKIPSIVFLGLGVGAALLALRAKMSGRSDTVSLLSMLTPSFLILGLYNKLIKLEGSD